MCRLNRIISIQLANSVNFQSTWQRLCLCWMAYPNHSEVHVVTAPSIMHDVPLCHRMWCQLMHWHYHWFDYLTSYSVTQRKILQEFALMPHYDRYNCSLVDHIQTKKLEVLCGGCYDGGKFQHVHNDGLVQEIRNSSALAMQLRVVFFTNPSIYKRGKHIKGLQVEI